MTVTPTWHERDIQQETYDLTMVTDVERRETIDRLRLKQKQKHDKLTLLSPANHLSVSQITTIPEARNWPRVQIGKMVGNKFSEKKSGNNAKNYNDVIMSAMTSQITSLTIVYSNVYSGANQRKHQSSASLAFVRGIHRWLVHSPHKAQ